MVDRVEEVVVGKRDVLELVLIGILADGHVLLEDLPGVAKTLIARSFAQATGIPFARVQFTPDLMPSDITGSSVFDQRTASFDFRPGPVFTSLLLGDEINRATPKTQAALLEAMQERQVTAEGHTHRLERPFSRHRHPEPDRVRGHLPAARGAARPVPAAGRGRVPVDRRRGGDARTAHRRGAPSRSRSGPVVDRHRLIAMQDALEDVHVSEPVRRYIVDVVTATRQATAAPGRVEPARVAGAARRIPSAGSPEPGATSSRPTT